MWEKAMKDRENPGCENLFLLDSPSQLGVRVTRVMNAVHNVSYIDSLSYKVYDDCIGLSGGDSSISYNYGTEQFDGINRPIWQIPYSALLPQKCPNLIVAGRCISFDEGLNYDAREVGTCFVTGQAAGVASALATNHRSAVQELNISLLQETLRKQNVYL